MMGLVVGDALGAPLEFEHVRYPPLRESELVTEMLDTEHFGIRSGQYTDDTSMSLCIADSLLVKRDFDPFDIMLRFQAWWHCGYNNCFRYDDKCTSFHSIGLGGNISKSMNKFIRDGEAYTTAGNIATSGNGSIMRNAPICLAYHNNIELAMKYAEAQSKITHQGIEAWENTRLLTWICVNLIQHKSSLNDLEQIIDRFVVVSDNHEIMKLIKSEDDFDWKKSFFRYNAQRTVEQPKYIGSYSTDCMAMALHCVYTTTCFEEALVKAVNMCGDADTVGAVTGQIAGAMYGYDEIPLRWLQSVTYWNSGSILYRAHLLYERNG
jgi:ADP-ribosylglycohydrolase